MSEDGEHGTGWLEVQRLPQELWGGVPPKRLPLRRLEHVFSEEEAAPILEEELLKVSWSCLVTRLPYVGGGSAGISLPGQVA